jgi:hypothetical protein
MNAMNADFLNAFALAVIGTHWCAASAFGGVAKMLLTME